MRKILKKVIWNEDSNGRTEDGWSWDRFVVNHDDSVDPFGYTFFSDNGARFVHSGDSGPCQTLSNAISDTDLVIIEMSIPEWVPSNHHHKPSDIDKLSKIHTEKKFIITHTFIDSPNSGFEKITEKVFPQHQNNVYHVDDGTVISWDNFWQIGEK
jgi:ribonuclease BN (tRNA processing enzyme)